MPHIPYTRNKVQELSRDGLSVAEIAKELGITTQAVYHHLERIRKLEGAKSAPVEKKSA